MTRMLKNSMCAATLGALLVAGPVAAAEYPVDVVAAGIPHDAFFAVDFTGDYGVAVGASPLSGALLRHSRDGGSSWQPVDIDTPLAVLGVAVTADRAVAVGQQGLTLVGDRDGDWQVVEAVSPERLMNVDMNASGQAMAVGAFGTVLTSSDGGRSWRNAAPDWMAVVESEAGITDMGPNLYGVQVEADGRATIAGEWGLIMRSDDGGSSWRVLHAGDTTAQKDDASLFGLNVGSGGEIVAVGQVGSVLYSRDDGRSWSRADAGTVANLLSVTRSASGKLVATAMRDMRISHDGGASWEPITGADFSLGWYSGSGAVAGSERVLAVGHSGRIVAIDVGDELAANLQSPRP